jgi:HPt (histidine-containing phosphotransfer) domain-containing protein
MAGEKVGGPVDLALLDPDGTFPARLAGDRAALIEHARALEALVADAREEKLLQIAKLAHRLAGAAGTFGHHAVSDAALDLETRILDRQPGEKPSQRHPAIGQAIAALVGSLDESLSGLKR